MAAVAAAGVVHRDLAARNVLLAAARPPVVRVADFGLSLIVPDAPASAAPLFYPGGAYGGAGRGRGTVPVRWAAPEGLMRGVWAEASDVWAFGVLLWEVRRPCPKNTAI